MRAYETLLGCTANKPPGRSLSSAIRVAIAKYFHGGDPTIYHCPGHIVPARDGSVHLTVRGKGRKAKKAIASVG